jgi:hypothetical protein
MNEVSLTLDLTGPNDGDNAVLLADLSFAPKHGTWMQATIDHVLTEECRLTGGAAYDPASGRYSLNVFANDKQVAIAIGFAVLDETYLGYEINGVGLLGIHFREQKQAV